MATPNQNVINTYGNPAIVAGHMSGNTIRSTTNKYDLSGHTNAAATYNFESTINGGQTTQSNREPEISLPRPVVLPPSNPSGGCADAQNLNSQLDSPIPLVAHNTNDTDALPHGLSLIINIHYYDPPHDSNTNRKGSELDVVACIALFKKFSIPTYVPPTEGRRVIRGHVDSWISDFKSKFVVGKTKACFVVIMGHGNDGSKVKLSDGSYFCMEEVIFTQFNNAHFPAMIHQPKIFFTNCCRGTVNTPPVPKPQGQPDAGETVPTIEDILVFWSTTPGNMAVRNTESGSDFINILCTRFDAYVEYLRQGNPGVDLKAILQSVSNKMLETRSDCDGLGVVTQVPNIDDRGFGLFIWRLDDSFYHKGNQCPF